MKHLFKLAIFVLFQIQIVNAQSTQLGPEKIHLVTTLETIQKLQTQHYEKLQINDKLSQDLLTSYLSILDLGKQVFLQSDIDSFTKNYDTKLDDQLKNGDVSAGFAIFNVYRDRTISQLEKTIKELPETIKTFNFTVDEDITIDRSKEPWPKTQKEIDDLWNKRLKAAVLSLKLSNKTPAKILELLTKRYKNQLARVKQMNSEDVYQTYMNSLTGLYDPHTNYLSPENSDNFNISMKLKLEGIGAMLNTKDEHTKVVRLIPAGPAAKEGNLHPSDRIIGVAQGKDGEMVDVVGWRLDDVVDLIRGAKGTVVKLEVIPANAISDDTTKTISITRDEVKLEEQSVQKAMIDVKDNRGITRKIGVLDIPAFYIDFEGLRNRDPNYKSTTRDTAKLLSELIQEGAEGIVIDLRDNGGGSLREANELTGLFIEKGPSVQIRMSDQRVYSEKKEIYSPYYSGPVVVLINRLSASASEIFAGAMQDYSRALIIGSRSYGKGTVQSLTPLSHGTLKLTESKFYRISGDSTQDHGVMPDIHLPDIYDEKIVGENASTKAMKWDSITPALFNKYNNFEPILTTLKQHSQKRAANDPDFIFLNKKNAYEKSLDFDKVSLLEKKRIAERTKDKEYRLKLLNEKLKAKGEKPLDSLVDDEDDEDDSSSKASEEIGKINVNDSFLIESAHILLDSIGTNKTDSKTTIPTKVVQDKKNSRLPANSISHPTNSEIKKTPATFNLASTELTRINDAVVNEILASLNENSLLTVRIEGFASSEGDINFNKRLSEKRAKSFMDYLVSKGVSSDRIKVIGRGIEKPVASNDTESGRQQNRRIEISVQ